MLVLAIGRPGAAKFPEPNSCHDPVAPRAEDWPLLILGRSAVEPLDPAVLAPASPAGCEPVDPFLLATLGWRRAWRLVLPATGLPPGLVEAVGLCSWSICWICAACCEKGCGPAGGCLLVKKCWSLLARVGKEPGFTGRFTGLKLALVGTTGRFPAINCPWRSVAGSTGCWLRGMLPFPNCSAGTVVIARRRCMLLCRD